MKPILRSNYKFILFVCISTFISQSVSVFSQEKMVSLKQIADSINQNNKKISNLRMRTVRVTLQPAELPSNSDPQDDASSTTIPNTNHGQSVLVNRSLILLSDSGRFVDEEEKSIGDKRILQRKERFWFSFKTGSTFDYKEKQQVLNKKGEVVEIAPVVYDQSSPLPLSPVEDLQIHLNDLTPEVEFSADCKVVGHEIYKGLQCLRIEWGQKDKSSEWGVYLVCPQRDWRILFQENRFGSGQKEGVKSIYRKMSVESLKHYDDGWVPSSVRTEYTMTGYDGKMKTSIDKLKVVDFNPNAVDEDALFDPSFSPGTRILSQEGVTIAGGNMTVLVAQLQSRDFSILDEEVTDLSKP